MISILFAFAALAIMLVCYRNDIAFLFVSSFLAWQFALKVLATAYLDVFGPVYSDEVFIWVGGHGNSTPFMVVAVLVPLMAIKLVLNRHATIGSAPEPYLAQGGTSLGDLFFWFSVAYLAALYVDLIRIGEIPFFSGAERFEYEGGIFHEALVSYISIVGFLFGMIAVRGRFVTGRWDLRLGAVIVALFLYLLLTGHRFGGFYVIVTCGLFSFAALWVGPRLGVLPTPAPPMVSPLEAALRSRGLITLFVIALLAFIAIGMYNSLYNVRDTAPLEALRQRFLVQPAHLYYLTWERAAGGTISGFAQVYSFIQNPFDPGRNSGIQYLMYLHLGAERAYQVYVRQGVDYAGGYPEIFMEMGGIAAAVLIAAAISLIVAILYRVSVLAIVSGRLLTALLAFYVCWTFINVILGGMVETFALPSFWLKAGVLIAVYVFEMSLERSGRRLTPWFIAPRR